MKKKDKKKLYKMLYTILFLIIAFAYTQYINPYLQSLQNAETSQIIEQGNGTYETSAEEAYREINNNIPTFTEEDKKILSQPGYEHYSNLDNLRRCGTAEACVGKETMPTEKRGSIGMIKPTGWHTSKYDFVDGKYLYNRCHLIAYCLTSENANEKNLITGTRYMNVVGMLPFENKVARYIDKTNHHVMYRVTPDFQENELVARGVTIMAQSIEDNEISFNVYCPNIQPGVAINYSTGENHES